MNVLKSFIRDESGQDMVEYGLLAAFISVVAISIIKTVGDDIVAVFQKISGAFNPA